MYVRKLPDEQQRELVDVSLSERVTRLREYIQILERETEMNVVASQIEEAKKTHAALQREQVTLSNALSQANETVAKSRLVLELAGIAEQNKELNKQHNGVNFGLHDERISVLHRLQLREQEIKKQLRGFNYYNISVADATANLKAAEARLQSVRAEQDILESRLGVISEEIRKDALVHQEWLDKVTHMPASRDLQKYRTQLSEAEERLANAPAVITGVHKDVDGVSDGALIEVDTPSKKYTDARQEFYDELDKHRPSDLSKAGFHLINTLNKATSLHFDYRTEVMIAARKLRADNNGQNLEVLHSLISRNVDGKASEAMEVTGSVLMIMGAALAAASAFIGILSLGFAAPLTIAGLALGGLMFASGAALALASGPKRTEKALRNYYDQCRLFTPVVTTSLVKVVDANASKRFS